ncbi:MAG: helix-turn-helix domain-containing protein [Acidobacteriota bacterium]|jgi:HTH-type transcriptional regulator/antitoxin HigA|nr:helix-turn-helix domain-containing protein [Acidobacteriota bacterium]
MQINNVKYGELLLDVLPKKIETEEENERCLKIVEKLFNKGSENFTPEEDKLFDLLTLLIEDFEEKAYPISNAPPNEVLKMLMEDRGMKQKDLVPVFGSEGVVSEILNGKRPITLKTAKKLQEFFGLSTYEFFI